MESVRSHRAYLLGALFRTGGKLQYVWVCVYSRAGMGWGASVRGSLGTLSRNMPYALSELGPAGLLSRLLENPVRSLKKIKKIFKVELDEGSSCATPLSHVRPVRTFMELRKHFCLIKKSFSRSPVSDPSCCDNDTAAEAERTPLPQITGSPLTQSFLPSAGAKSKGRASAAPPPSPHPHKSRKRQPWPLAL